MAHDVFISYSSKDKPTADAVCAKLEQRGIRCWMAPRDILPSADWSGSIIDGINGARVMVLVFSANANASVQIKREVERAVHKAIPIIPLRIENVAPEQSLEYFISTPHWLDAFTAPLDHHLTYLADVIRHILDGQAIPAPPPPPLPPWWRGPAGLAVGGVAIIAIAVIAWFTLLRPPPAFTGGNWAATQLDVHQFTTENALLSAQVPAQMLDAALKGPGAKGSLTVQPSGRFNLAVSGMDQGSVTATPAAIAATGTALTFTSDITHASLTVNMLLFQESSANNGSQIFDPASDAPPNGQTMFQLMLMPAGETSGVPVGTFTGKPAYQGPSGNGNNNLQTMAVIAGNWGPQQLPYAPGVNSAGTSAQLVITAAGRYSFSYALNEAGLWHATNGNWTRQIPSGAFSPPSTDGGTYTFQGRNKVSLFDQFGTSVWQR